MSSPTSYMKRYVLERHQGISHRVPATRAAAHITALHDAGMTWAQIASQIDHQPSAAAHLLRRAKAGANINLATERAWLTTTYQHPTTQRRALKITPEVGTGRRIRALAALGWTWTALSHETGVAASHLSDIARQNHKGRVGGLTATRIRSSYDRLSMTRPEGAKADRARAVANRNNWPPPLAWDEDTIDDPKARPAGLARTRRRAA